MSKLVPMYFQNWTDDTLNDEGCRLTHLFNQFDPDKLTVIEESILQTRSTQWRLSQGVNSERLIRPVIRHPDLMLPMKKCNNKVEGRVRNIGCYITSLYNAMTLCSCNPYESLASFIGVGRFYSFGKKPQFEVDGSFSGNYSLMIPGFRAGFVYPMSKGKFVVSALQRSQVDRDDQALIADVTATAELDRRNASYYAGSRSDVDTIISSMENSKQRWFVGNPKKWLYWPDFGDKLMFLVKVVGFTKDRRGHYSKPMSHWLATDLDQMSALVFHGAKTIKCFNPWKNEECYTDGALMDTKYNPIYAIHTKHISIKRPRNFRDIGHYFNNKDIKVIGNYGGFSDNMELDSGYVDIDVNYICQIREICYGLGGMSEQSEAIRGGKGGPGEDELFTGIKDVRSKLDLTTKFVKLAEAIIKSKDFNSFIYNINDYIYNEFVSGINRGIALEIATFCAGAFVAAGAVWAVPACIPLEYCIENILNTAYRYASEAVCKYITGQMTLRRQTLPVLQKRGISEDYRRLWSND